MHLNQPEKRNQQQQNRRWEEGHNSVTGLYSDYLVKRFVLWLPGENTASLMKSVATPLKNVFVSIKAVNYFNGIDLGQNADLQCGDPYYCCYKEALFQMQE